MGVRRKGSSQSLSAVMALRDMVLDGDLAAGERLYEVPLAERLGISRTPLRFALTRLEEEGLLERRSTTGYVVRKFGFDDVADAIELRGVIEGTAARLAAERGISDSQSQALDVLIARLDRAVGGDAEALDFDAYVAANEEFHDVLSRLSGSELVRREVERATRLPFASPSAFLKGQRDVEAFRRSLGTAQEQHRAVVEAIRHREGARAEAVMREHARLARRNLEHAMYHDRSLIRRVPGLALVAS